MAFGTLRGAHIIWDLRYHMMATKFHNEDNRAVVNLNLINSCGPSSNGQTYYAYNSINGINLESAPVTSWPKYLASTVEGCNQINFFDLEKKELESQIIADPEKATTKEELPHFTSCYFFGKNQRKLITAGLDRMVRYWDLDQVNNSFTVVDAPYFKAGSNRENTARHYFIPSGNKTYEMRISQNIRILQEFQHGKSNYLGCTNGTGKNGRIINGDISKTISTGNNHEFLPDDKFIYSPLPHVDAISDMKVCHVYNHNAAELQSKWQEDKAPNAFTVASEHENFIITGTRDGWVNVWK